MSDERYAEYKGRTYRLVWHGDTKFGSRAKLAFLNGQNEFWVGDEHIKLVDAPPPQRDNAPTRRKYGKNWGRCWECGCEGWLDGDGYCGC